MKDTHVLYLYLAFSSIAVVLILLFVATASSPSPPLSFLEKLGIAGLFILCCILGISFAFRPNWIRRYFRRSTNEEENEQPSMKQSFQGHHPACVPFQNHTIQWRKKTWCAGCLGLFIGLCIAILFMVLYIIYDVQPTRIVSYLFLLLGWALLAMVYGETLIRSRHAIVHIVINSMLPLSFFFIIIAVGSVTGTFISSFFTILLCFLWLDTRIQLSKRHHRLLCTRCPESCKMFPETG
ncbi:MAG: hypothetical protein JXA75_06315 [Candidatus Thermoplasmatota archaeon]|nr:hypothetical protein [Candidatus Thermoplasmatota archaeon]